MTLKLTAKRRGGENVSGPVFQTVAGERLEPILKARISRPAEGMGFEDGLVYRREIGRASCRERV